jgi:hypothetical protein
MKSVIEGGAQVGIKIGMGKIVYQSASATCGTRLKVGKFVEYGLYGPKFDGLVKRKGRCFFEFFIKLIT